MEEVNGETETIDFCTLGMFIIGRSKMIRHVAFRISSWLLPLLCQAILTSLPRLPPSCSFQSKILTLSRRHLSPTLRSRPNTPSQHHRRRGNILSHRSPSSLSSSLTLKVHWLDSRHRNRLSPGYRKRTHFLENEPNTPSTSK